MKCRSCGGHSLETILDLGNGIGKTTASLSEIFPNADCTGTNIKESEQWEYCEKIKDAYNFKMAENSTEIAEVDLAFASEYFEHFEKPIEHLEEIIKNNAPKYFIIANSFGTIGIGHFKEYIHNNEIIDWKKISRLFNTRMRELNYKKVKTGFFNDTPNVWALDKKENW